MLHKMNINEIKYVYITEWERVRKMIYVLYVTAMPSVRKYLKINKMLKQIMILVNCFYSLSNKK